MSLNLTPLEWNWASVKAGDTFPAARITESLGTDSLTRVQIFIRPDGATADALVLDSDATGIVINDAAARDFTISEIAEVALAAGVYFYDMIFTYDTGTVRTEFTGSWEILERI